MLLDTSAACEVTNINLVGSKGSHCSDFESCVGSELLYAVNCALMSYELDDGKNVTSNTGHNVAAFTVNLRTTDGHERIPNPGIVCSVPWVRSVFKPPMSRVPKLRHHLSPASSGASSIVAQLCPRARSPLPGAPALPSKLRTYETRRNTAPPSSCLILAPR